MADWSVWSSDPVIRCDAVRAALHALPRDPASATARIPYDLVTRIDRELALVMRPRLRSMPTSSVTPDGAQRARARVLGSDGQSAHCDVVWVGAGAHGTGVIVAARKLGIRATKMGPVAVLANEDLDKLLIAYALVHDAP